MRRIVGRAIPLGFIAVLAVAGNAQAASVSAVGQTITFTAAAGETNNLTVSRDATAFAGQPGIVFDDVVPVTAAGPSGCMASGDNAVCPDTTTNTTVIGLGDLNDTLTFLGSYPADQDTEISGAEGSDDLTGSAAVDEIDGGAGDDFMNGAASDDVLIGGAGPDDMQGGAGTGDTVSYAGVTEAVRVTLDGVENDGAKCQSGGPGPCESDNVGSNVNDVENVVGGDGNDTIIGQGIPGLNPNTVNDFDGGDGNDTLLGQGGADDLSGDAADDTFIGGAGDDAFHGGGGIDTVSYEDRPDTEDVTVDLDADTGGSGAETDTMPDNDVQNARGGAGDDTLIGGTDDNVLDGAAGDDTLSGEGTDGPSQDVFIGGAGSSDEVLYSHRTDETIITIDGQANDGAHAGGTVTENDNVRTDVEELTGGSVDDRLTGSDGDDRLTGGAGDDLIDGKLGTDVLQGGAHGVATGQNGANGDIVSYASRTSQGVSVTLAGAADDGAPSENDDAQAFENATGGSANDVLIGSATANRVDGGPGNDSLAGGGAADTLVGGAGTEDVADYSLDTRVAGVTVSLDSTGNDGTTAGAENDNVQTENVTGTAFGDTITGSGEANDLSGLGGVDTLNGAASADALFGGADDDSLSGGSSDDTLDGGAGADDLNGSTGSDTVSYATRSAGVTVALGTVGNGEGGATENDDIGLDIENAVGGSGNDTITGTDDRTNRLDGGGGNDTLDGGDTVVPDTLVGGAGVDTADYGTRTEQLDVSLDDTPNDGAVVAGVQEENDDVLEIENVTTGSGNDNVAGNASANTISTGDGSDTVAVRDTIADTANCGAGADTATADNLDVLTACETANVVAIAGNNNPGGNAGGGGGTTTPNPPQAPGPPQVPPTPPTPDDPLATRRQPRSVSATVGPRRDRRAPFRFLVSGTVSLPQAIASSRSTVCAAGGTVTVQAKVGGRTVATRRVRIDRDCSYDVTFAFRRAATVLGSRRSASLRFTARFGGNRYLLARQARTVTGRAG